MADLFAEIRSGPFIELSTGLLTIRWATFLDDMADQMNTNTSAVEDSESIFTEIQRVASFSGQQAADIAEIDQLATELSMANTRIAEMQKFINDLNQLIPDI